MVQNSAFLVALAFHTFSWFTLGPWRSQGVALKALGTQNQRPARIEHLPMETMGQNGEGLGVIFPNVGDWTNTHGIKITEGGFTGNEQFLSLGDPPQMIDFDILSHIISHLFRHIPPIWHMSWHSIWYLIWHSSWHIIWHSAWHCGIYPLVN